MKTLVVFAALLISCGVLFCQEPVATVPFRWVMNQIVLTVEVGDYGPMNFMLDSGANPSLVDIATASSLDLIVRRARRAPGAVVLDSTTDFVAPLHDLRIGPLQIDSLFAMTVNLTASSSFIGVPLQGVLGYSFFKDRILQIDYRRRVIRFYDESPTFEASGNAITLPMSLHGERRIPIVDSLMVNGRTLNVGIDTGSSLGLLIFPAAVDELGFTEYIRKMRQDSVLHGESGATGILRGHRATVQLAGAHFDAVPIEFAQTGWEGEDTSVWGGMLGNDFFQGCRLTLDYKNGLVTIER